MDRSVAMKPHGASDVIGTKSCSSHARQVARVRLPSPCGRISGLPQFGQMRWLTSTSNRPLHHAPACDQPLGRSRESRTPATEMNEGAKIERSAREHDAVGEVEGNG